MAPSGMLRRVALVRADVSEELSASFIRVTRIGELGRTLAVTSNRRAGVRRLECEADYSPPASAEAKKYASIQIFLHSLHGLVLNELSTGTTSSSYR
jgi:hypothetical protein